MADAQKAVHLKALAARNQTPSLITHTDPHHPYMRGVVWASGETGCALVHGEGSWDRLVPRDGAGTNIRPGHLFGTY